MTGIALLMVALSNSAAAAAYDSFPMDSGNFWVFDAPEGHRTIAVDHTDALGGGWYASDAEGLLADPVTVYDSDSSDEMIVDDGADLSALFDFGAADGDSWSFSLSSCDTYDVTAATDSAGSLTTPAGTFRSLSGFVLDHVPASTGCDDAPLSRIKFAQDVGPVSFTDAAGERGRLLFASVGGTVVAASAYDSVTDSGLSVTFIVNADEVSGGSTTVVAVLQNTTDAAIDLTRGGFIIDIFDRMDISPTSLGASGSLTVPAGGVASFSTTLDLSGLTEDFTVRATLQDEDYSAALSVDIAR